MFEPPPLPRVTSFGEGERLAQELAQAVVARREAELRCAALLAEIEMRDASPWVGCHSVGEVGERAGLSADEARGLCDLGRALPGDPLLERRVREGRIPVRAACAVSRVLLHPELQRDDDDWIHWAETETVKKLQRRVRERVEQARAGDEPVVPVMVFVRQPARAQFDRAREVASGKAGRALTHGETFETVVDHYLDSFDVDRITPGTRRVGPTTHVAGRYIPMMVRREIYERQGHACAVPLCGNTLFLEHAHIQAHACGGSREADNLILVCSFHHWLFDRGDIRLAGTAAQPVFLDKAGRDLAGRWRLGGTPVDNGVEPPPSTLAPPGAAHPPPDAAGRDPGPPSASVEVPVGAGTEPRGQDASAARSPTRATDPPPEGAHAQVPSSRQPPPRSPVCEGACDGACDGVCDSVCDGARDHVRDHVCDHVCDHACEDACADERGHRGDASSDARAARRAGDPNA